MLLEAKTARGMGGGVLVVLIEKKALTGPDVM